MPKDFRLPAPGQPLKARESTPSRDTDQSVSKRLARRRRHY